MFDDIIAYYIDYISSGGEDALITVCNLAVCREVIMSKYSKVAPIETTTEEEKTKLWLFVKEKFADHPAEEQVTISKCIHTIGNLIG